MNTKGQIIRRAYLGGFEDVTWEDFVGSAVQDEQTAVEIAFAMLEGDGTHNYGSADEGGFETFEIIDRDGLRRALELVEI